MYGQKKQKIQRGLVMHIDPRALPTLLIVIDVLAAGVYALDGGMREWRMVGYWLSAAAITFFVTW